jgi:hypothetical protein
MTARRAFNALATFAAAITLGVVLGLAFAGRAS